MKVQNRETYIEEEIFLVQHSGEIPEVALHGSLYYLAEDDEGPGLQLDADDILRLKQAVIKRYREIILRDLNPDNRDKRVYRGLARCLVNWNRLLKFCTSEHLDNQAIRHETADALKEFLGREVSDVQSGRRCSSINCSREEVEDLTNSLGLFVEDLPAGWREVCPEP